MARSPKQQPASIVERGAVQLCFEGTPDLDVLRAILASLRDGRKYASAEVRTGRSRPMSGERPVSP
jgi:hypothetical protein